jgi:hypothetical protein
MMKFPAQPKNKRRKERPQVKFNEIPVKSCHPRSRNIPGISFSPVGLGAEINSQKRHKYPDTKPAHPRFPNTSCHLLAIKSISQHGGTAMKWHAFCQWNVPSGALRLAFLRFQNWSMVFVASSSHSRFASSAINSTALKNFTAFGFGLPNGRNLPAVTRTREPSAAVHGQYARGANQCYN